MSKCNTRQNAVVQRHPRPTDTIPVQREIPVAFYIRFKPLVGVAVLVKYFDNLHAVDIFDNRAVHPLGGAVIAVHFAHAAFIHKTHGHQADGQGAQTQQCQLPVHKEHRNVYQQRHRKVRQSFRNCMSQKQFDGFDIVDKYLFQRAGSFALYGSQRLHLQLFCSDTRIFFSVL